MSKTAHQQVAVLAKEPAREKFMKWLHGVGYTPHDCRMTGASAANTLGQVLLPSHHTLVSYLPDTAEAITDRLLMQLPEGAQWLQCAPIDPPAAEALVLRARRAGVDMFHMRYLSDPVTTPGKPAAVVYGHRTPDHRLIAALTRGVDWIGPLRRPANRPVGSDLRGHHR